MNRLSITIPHKYKLGWVKSDYAMYGMSGIERHEKELGVELWNEVNGLRVRTFGIPLPVAYFDISPTDTREGTETRRLHLDIFRKHAPKWTSDKAKQAALVKQAWLGVMSDDRAFSDYGGGDGFRYNPRISRRNVVYIMGSIVRMGGRVLYPVRMLQVGSYSFMDEQLREFPLLAFDALTSVRGMGGRQVDPFWFLGGRPCKVLPFHKNAINYIDASNIRVLGQYEPIPSTCWPAR